MKTWYYVVCDEHKERTRLFVNNPSTTYHYLKDNDQTIQKWLEKHYSCNNLRLVWKDDQLDEIHEYQKK